MASANSKSTKSPAFQFYPRDFFSSAKVDAMSMTERGVYITLLGRCWLDQGLPVDMALLAKFARMKPAQFERMWTGGTLRQCFYERGGKFQNERLDHERKVQADFRRRQAANGIKGGRPRNPEKPTGSFGLTQPKPNESSASASAFSSASASAEKRDVRPAPIIARRRLDAAWEGPKGLYVPQRKHSDFIQLRDHPNAERELLAWYGEVAEAWSGSPGADMMKFWTARYDEKWPAPDSRLPAWAR